MNTFRAFMDWGRSDSDNDDDDESCTMHGPAEQRSQSSCSSSLFSGVEFASSSDEEEDNDNNHRGRLFSDEDWFSEDALHGVNHVSEHIDGRLKNCPRPTSRCRGRDDVEVVFSQQQQEPSTSLRNQTNEQHITRDRRVVYEAESLDEEMDLELVYDASDETLGADELTVHSSFDSPAPCRCASPIRPKLKKKRRNDSLEHYSKCIHCWGHGVVTTILTVALAWAGCVLAILARRGTDFLVLRDPLYISAMYNPVDQVGLLRMQLCYNETYDEHLYGCQTIPISASTADDIMMTLARLCIASSAVCGAFFTIFLTTAVVWESIRMKPIGFGLLMTYFLQSFTMLAFDSNVCDAHQCWIGRGCYYCIGASLCWLGACIGAAKMDTQKWQQRRERRRMFHRLARAAKEAQLAEIDGCNGANVTAGTATSSDTSSSEDDDLDPELCIF